MILERVRLDGADRIFPEEYNSIDETLLMGEALLLEDEPEQADKHFHLAWMKGKLLQEELDAEKLRLANSARLKAEAEQRERQKIAREIRNQHLAEQAAQAKAGVHEKKNERSRQNREKPLPVYHIVAHGETLPQIAAQPDVYGDQALWPLLYRANRDQISDPGHIRPGQILRIPRNVSREELSEARRFSQEKPIR